MNKTGKETGKKSMLKFNCEFYQKGVELVKQNNLSDALYYFQECYKRHPGNVKVMKIIDKIIQIQNKSYKE